MIPFEGRQHIIEELAYGCGMLWLRHRTVGKHECDACWKTPPPHPTPTTVFYTVYVSNPFTWSNEIHPWGVVCWDCAAWCVAEGAITSYLASGEEELWKP